MSHKWRKWQTAGAPWGDVLRTHQHVCQRCSTEPNQRKQSENSRLWDTLRGNCLGLFQMSMSWKIRKERDAITEQGQQTFSVKVHRVNTLHLWAIQTHLCYPRQYSKLCDYGYQLYWYPYHILISSIVPQMPFLLFIYLFFKSRVYSRIMHCIWLSCLFSIL